QTTALISAQPNGTAGGNADSYGPAVSPDGQFVAFNSFAGNLVAGDNNGTDDVFVRDLSAGTTTLVSARSPLLPPTLLAGGDLAGVSADGSQVLYTVNSTGLYVPGLADGGYSPFVLIRNTQTGAVSDVDLTPNGSQAAGESNSSYQNTPVLSA